MNPMKNPVTAPQHIGNPMMMGQGPAFPMEAKTEAPKVEVIEDDPVNEFAKETVKEIGDRDVWDANEMTEEEREKLLATWNEVAAHQSAKMHERVMDEVWFGDEQEEAKEESKKEVWKAPVQNYRKDPMSMFSPVNKYLTMENPGQ